MKTKVSLVMVSVLGIVLSGCAKAASPTAQAGGLPVIEIPSETPAHPPTSVPAVWDVATTMMNECTDVFGAVDPKNPPADNPFVRVNYGQANVDAQSDVTIWYQEESLQRASKGDHTPLALADFPGASGNYHAATDYGFPAAVDAYAFKVISQIFSQHPEFLRVDSDGNRLWQGASAGEALVNDGQNSNPWSYLDYTPPVSDTNYDPRRCPSAVLFTQSLPANEIGDGILVGEAYLFYEVGGKVPFQVDGQLKEVHFSFSPAR
ncbi:MAG: hypothetical protein ABSG98_10190 [Anaerolineales bacterium]|jgi:hypothetical protein